MKDNQSKIMEFASKNNIAIFGLREIGRLTGIKNPQTVKYYIGKLVKKGLIDYNLGKKNYILNLECSNCGFKGEVKIIYGMEWNKKHCPNCGTMNLSKIIK